VTFEDVGERSALLNGQHVASDISQGRGYPALRSATDASGGFGNLTAESAGRPIGA
jgi:hypothetical protein